MGVKYFFSFIKSRFPESVHRVNQPLENVDNLMIDLNGIFHTCSQKVYGGGGVQYYLTYKPRPPTLKQQLNTFEKIWDAILEILKLGAPRRRLILCIDGVAPFAKQTQQRQRRFRSVKDKVKGEWDSNCITPGTQFMDHLSRFIDFKIKEFLTINSEFRGLEVIFSNEKCPQEGEHKLIKWVRSQPDNGESYCMHGMDADLVMLGLSTGKKKFTILRQNHINPREHFSINLDTLGGSLAALMGGSTSGGEAGEVLIRDFVFMMFTVGNDFLPHLPVIEILEGGIEILMDAYKLNYSKHGSLTEKIISATPHKTRILFRKKSFSEFLKILGRHEQQILVKKANHFIGYSDPILEECKTTKNISTIENSQVGQEIYKVDFDRYKTSYYAKKLKISSDKSELRKVCLSYIEGVQWVLDYYTTGITSWKWYYPYYYTVFSSDLSEFVEEYNTVSYPPTSPLSPFEQLLCVLPPFSNTILPPPLNHLLVEEKSPIQRYYPISFEVDLEGKRNDWEGIAILPFIDLNLVQSHYRKFVKKIDQKSLSRNIIGHTYIYKWNHFAEPESYQNFYGKIVTQVESFFIDF